MSDYEKLGVFYLGREYDLAARQPTSANLLYDAKDLCTHAVVVGMTGSGKTGLCLSLLEEAAIDNIPAICIDPKGDLGNLMLTFPQLRPEDFKPWIDAGEATCKGMTVDELAKKTARDWREGLKAWDQDPARIQKFRDAVDVAIYTPGSQAGLPLTVLKSFNAPGPAVMQNADALRERVVGSVSGLLSLLGIEGDPLRSREHILLQNILSRAWQSGRDLDLGSLIREIQSPPIQKIGVIDLESVFPAKDRFELAMSLNNLLASPGFQAWMEGEPLDIQRLLYTPEGKPRLTILSIAHLSDAERMFFVTILLNEVIAWMRAQPGTSSLRALLYMDEVFGYFPPTANPPSKTPMLTLLKQARAFGLGCVLATQNPVDVDYKGLSNAGTWFLGRLQTERDKARVLDGLEGACTSRGAKFDRSQMETILSGLGNRVFLMNNVHDDHPVVFQSRWALSFLRGPISREGIQSLMAPRKASMPAASAPATSTASITATGSRPVVPPTIPETFVPRRGNVEKGASLVYRPALLGQARVHFAQASTGIDLWETLALTLPLDESSASFAWDDAAMSTDEPQLDSSPEEGATFAPLPAAITGPKVFAGLSTSLKDFLYRSHTLSVWKCPALKQTSQPGESEGDFRVRISTGSREQRDLQVEKLRAKYGPKLATLHEKIRKAEQRVEKQKQEASHSTFQAAINVGTSILGAMFGRKLASASNITRAATSVRSASKIAKERTDVSQAEDNVSALQEQVTALEEQFKGEAEALQQSFGGDSLKLERVDLKPKKADITVTRVTLAWTPWSVGADGTAVALAD